MRVTRRFWIDVALLVGLIALAVLFARPILLVGAAIIGAFLLTDQYRFARAIIDSSDRLVITQSIDEDRVYAHEETDVTIGGDLGRPASLEITIEAGVPIGVTSESPPQITISTGENEATATIGVRASTAGSFRFRPPLVKMEDEHGRFIERFEMGPTPEFGVEPGASRNLHIGRQARSLNVHGDHSVPEFGSGFELAELRKYVVGDPVNRIDWKATARLSTPYVREFETETDRKVVLLIDHRGTMDDGPPGETKLAYARHVALTFVSRTHESADPIGCYAVDENGMTVRLPPSASRVQYVRVRNAVEDLEPTTRTDRHVGGSTALEARWKAGRLDDDSAFAAHLRPYFTEAFSYHERIEHDPLSIAVRTYMDQLQGPIWTVLLTDDVHRTEVQEAVSLACRSGSHVLIFIAPTVLFGRDALENPNAAYGRYAEFERFRRSLDRMERVSAFELAPEDRLRAVLSAERNPETSLRS